MHKLHSNRLEMFERVLAFAKAYRELFYEKSLGREQLTKITPVLSEIKKLETQQKIKMQDAKGETGAKSRARSALRTDLNRIVQTARFIARTVPEFDEPFKFPRSEGDAALLYTARVFAERAAPVSEVFIQYGIPSTFVEDLNTHIRNIEEALRSRAGNRLRHKTATAAIDAAMKIGMNVILSFDVIVANVLRGDKKTLKRWKTARHVQRPRRSKAAKAKAAKAGTAGQA